MKIKLLMFFLVLANQTISAVNNSCDCDLKVFVIDNLNEKPNVIQDTIKLKVLSNKQIRLISKSLCTELGLSMTRGFDPNKFKNHILKIIEIDQDEPNANLIISKFLSKYKNELICPKNSQSSVSRNLHLYKAALLDGIIDLYDEILLDDEEYQIDFNAYELVDGKKETILDYIDKLITENYGDIEELESIRDVIIELGGKKGKDLK